MLRIILGVFLLLGSINPASISRISELETVEAEFGFMLARILFIYLSIWLIATGIKKRKSKLEAKTGVDTKSE